MDGFSLFPSKSTQKGVGVSTKLSLREKEREREMMNQLLVAF